MPVVAVVDRSAIVEPGAAATVRFRVSNDSTVVDGFRLSVVHGPQWLELTHPEVRLLPGRDEVVPASLAMKASATRVPAQKITVRVAIASIADSTKVNEHDIDLEVPRKGEPVRLRTDPAVVRVLDAAVGRVQVFVDNARSNYAQRYTLSAKDPENAVEFRFETPVVDIQAFGEFAVALEVDPPDIEPGSQLSRPITVSAYPITSDGPQTHADATTTFTIAQERTAAARDQPVRLRLRPEVLRLVDSQVGQVAVIIDNRVGARDRELHLEGRDTEGVLEFSFPRPVVRVAAGATALAAVEFRAPAPQPGQEVTRRYTIVTNDGEAESEVAGSIVHVMSRAAIETAELTLRPQRLRVVDTESGTVIVVVDNSKSASPLRVRMTATDPEAAMRFAFAPPILEAPAGGTASCRMTLIAAQPEPGTDVTREFEVVAESPERAVKVAGAFIQVSSPSAVSSLKLILEPEQLRMQDVSEAVTSVVIDNRQAARPVQLQLGATDPERALQFQFEQPVVYVPPGGVHRTQLRISAPMPEPGKQLTREFTVAARDQTGVVEQGGQLLQSRSLSPITTAKVAVVPERAEVRNRRQARFAVYIDNRSGVQPLVGRFYARDKENLVTFKLDQQTVQIPPGQVGTVMATVSAPRPPANKQAQRDLRFTVEDRTGSQSGDATFVQVSGPRGEILRPLLTLLGALLVFVGALAPWVNPQPDLYPNGAGFTKLTNDVSAVFFPPQNLAQIWWDLGLAYSVQPVLRILEMLLAVVIALGLIDRSGKATRRAAFFALVLIAIAVAAVYLAALTSFPTGAAVAGTQLLVNTGTTAVPELGEYLVIVGAILGFGGGVVARRSSRG